jgi:hypothetical protein
VLAGHKKYGRVAKCHEGNEKQEELTASQDGSHQILPRPLTLKNEIMAESPWKIDDT